PSRRLPKHRRVHGQTARSAGASTLHRHAGPLLGLTGRGRAARLCNHLEIRVRPAQYLSAMQKLRSSSEWPAALVDISTYDVAPSLAVARSGAARREGLHARDK